MGASVYSLQSERTIVNMNDTGKKLLSLKVLIYTTDLLHDHDIVADPKRPALQVCNRRSKSSIPALVIHIQEPFRLPAETNFEGVNAAATSGHCSKRKMKGHLVMARRNPPEILRILPIDGRGPNSLFSTNRSYSSFRRLT